MTRWILDRNAQPAAPSTTLRRLLADGADDRECAAAAAEWAEDVRAEDGAEVAGGDTPIARPTGVGAVDGLHLFGEDDRAARARLGHALAGDPAQALPVVGVTGASGKAAVGAFLRAICRAEGQVVGSVGAATWFDGDSIRPLGPRRPSPSSSRRSWPRWSIRVATPPSSKSTTGRSTPARSTDPAGRRRGDEPGRDDDDAVRTGGGRTPG